MQQLVTPTKTYTKAPPKKRTPFMKLGDIQDMYRAANKIVKRTEPDTFVFVPHDVEFKRGKWIVWRTDQDKARAMAGGARAPRPVVIPAAITRFINAVAMEVPLNFAINTNLPRNWYGDASRHAA